MDDIFKSPAMIEAMTGMGWDPTCRIPMANEENMSLLKELDDYMVRRIELKGQIKHLDDRVEKLHQHKKNAEGCINHNLKLIHAQKTELHEEEHRIKIHDREGEKLKQDIKNNEKELTRYKQFIEGSEKELNRKQCSVNDMIKRMKWAKTALIEWNEAIEDGHKGYKLIEKYFKEDQHRAHKQNQKRQQLQNDIHKIRDEVIKMTDEQKSLEQGLECTSNLYRTAHTERRQMVETWKTAVNHMTQREVEIHNKEDKLGDLQMESKAKRDELKSFDDRLNAVIESNRNTERTIEELNEETSTIKVQIQEFMDSIILRENDVDLLQKELQNVANRVIIQRHENKHNEKVKKDKASELENFQNVLNQLNERLMNMKNSTMDAQQRLQLLEQYNDEEQKTQVAITREVTIANGMLYRANTQLTKFTSDTKQIQMENDGIKVTIEAVIANAKEEEKKLRRSTEIHYGLAFKLLQIESRINHLKGGLIDPEVEHKHLMHLQHLENVMVNMNKRLQATESQNKKLDDNMRSLTIAFNEDGKKLILINEKVKEALTYCAGGVKRLKTEERCNQLLIVELSLLKMHANEFENEINACELNSYNLAKHRMNLNRTIKDRMIEIKSQVELLQLKKKHLAEECSTMKADIGERTKCIDSVKSRFELTAKLLGNNEDGSLITATQLKVEAAQEKHMLLEEGNQLNEKVLHAENEIEAMENTLMIFHHSNDNFRKSFREFDTNAEATLEFNNLKENYCKSLKCLRELRIRLLNCQKEIENTVLEKENLEIKFDELNKEKLEQLEIFVKLDKELSNQKAKLHRAEREIRKTLKEIKENAISEQYVRIYCLELDLREINLYNTNVLNQINNYVQHDLLVGSRIVQMLSDKGINMPSVIHKSSSLSSWRSDITDISMSSSKDVISIRSFISNSSALKMFKSESQMGKVSVLSLTFDGRK